MIRELNTLESGRVTRYHAAPTVSPQALGHHSWGVAVLCMALTEPSLDLLRAALLHDAGEIVTGDIPFTIKRSSSAMKHLTDELEALAHQDVVMEMPTLSPEEAAVLKLADTLEGLLWCRKTEREGPVGARWEQALAFLLKKYQDLLHPDVLARAVRIRDANPRGSV